MGAVLLSHIRLFDHVDSNIIGNEGQVNSLKICDALWGVFTERQLRFIETAYQDMDNRFFLSKEDKAIAEEIYESSHLSEERLQTIMEYIIDNKGEFANS